MTPRFLATGLGKRPSSEKRHVHRRPVVAKPGQGVSAGRDRAIRNGGLLEHSDVPTLGGEVQRGGQAVAAGPDQHGIKAVLHGQLWQSLADIFANAFKSA